MRATTVFFLAAGFGTRLRPLTDELPKALVPVGNRPQLLRLAQRFADRRLVANTHHLADRLATAIGGWRERGLAELTISREHDVLGTAGGIRAARALFADGAVLVHNADIEVHPEAVRAAFAEVDPSAVATLLVGREHESRRGNLGLDEDRRIVRLRHTQISGAREVASCNYLGVAQLAAHALEALPERGCLVGDVWIPALLAGATLRACNAAAAEQAERSFFDLGTPASYLAANLRWLDDADLLVRAERGSHVHPNARHVLVGEGARLEAAAERVIVWPGATLHEPLRDAIVTPNVRVQVG